VFEYAVCHRQESSTAGVFHRTQTDLTKWFLAAYLMGGDKRGVSAKFLQRELGVAYQTAGTVAHKLRHGPSEHPSRPLQGFLEADETFIGGRGDPTSPGRSTANPDKGWSSLPSKRRKGAGAEEPERKAWARRHAPARVLCRHRGIAGRDGGPNRAPSLKPIACPCKGRGRRQFASADRRVCRLSRPRG
jgi:hypothetical protein